MRSGWHEKKFQAARKPEPRPCGEGLVQRLITAFLTLLLVCFASSVAYAQSCTTTGRIAFPFDAGQNNPFKPGDSRTTRFSFNGQVGDTLTFQADPGPPGTSEIALLSAANPAT